MVFKDLFDSVLEEEKRVGDYQYNNTVVNIYFNEGPIPHVHVISGNGESHPRLDRADYLVHKDERFFVGKEKKVFDDFMASPNKEKPNITNWKWCIDKWNEVSQFKAKTTEKPDYTQLPDKR